MNLNELCIEMTSTENTVCTDGICPTLTARMGTGGGQVNAVLYDRQKQGVYGENECSSTLTAHEAKEGNEIVCQTFKGDVCGTLDAHYAKCPGERGGVELDVVAVDCRNGTENPDLNGTLQEKSNGGVSYNLQNVVRGRYIVRRLTPLECERLQGYPDGWTDIGEWTDTKGKKHKPADSPRYKALGNSIAIPPWLFVLSRLNEYCEEKTMASLFDGIGGFPLIWEFLNGTGSAVWCSEIEEFPIAVTKLRFPEREET